MTENVSKYKPFLCLNPPECHAVLDRNSVKFNILSDKFSIDIDHNVYHSILWFCCPALQKK